MSPRRELHERFEPSLAECGSIAGGVAGRGGFAPALSSRRRSGWKSRLAVVGCLGRRHHQQPTPMLEFFRLFYASQRFGIASRKGGTLGGVYGPEQVLTSTRGSAFGMLYSVASPPLSAGPRNSAMQGNDALAFLSSHHLETKDPRRKIAIPRAKEYLGLPSHRYQHRKANAPSSLYLGAYKQSWLAIKLSCGLSSRVSFTLAPEQQ